MSFDPYNFILANYPRLYHMAEEGSWPSIAAHGLLSTASLLDLFEVPSALCTTLLESRRPESVTIRHPGYGTAVVRDQKPLTEKALVKCLIDLEPKEWCRLLNSRVYFWPTRARLMRLLSARAYRSRAHDVITVDTARLLARYGSSTVLSPINSGSTVYNPRPRGAQTFQAPQSYPWAERIQLRGRREAVAEIAVDEGIRDILDVAVEVNRMQMDATLVQLWKRS